MQEGHIISDSSTDELLSTDVLETAGIREPLYITALKYAGVDITPGMNPHSIRTVEISESDKEKAENGIFSAMRACILHRSCITEMSERVLT